LVWTRSICCPVKSGGQAVLTTRAGALAPKLCVPSFPGFSFFRQVRAAGGVLAGRDLHSVGLIARYGSIVVRCQVVALLKPLKMLLATSSLRTCAVTQRTAQIRSRLSDA